MNEWIHSYYYYYYLPNARSLHQLDVATQSSSNVWRPSVIVVVIVVRLLPIHSLLLLLYYYCCTITGRGKCLHDEAQIPTLPPPLRRPNEGRDGRRGIVLCGSTNNHVPAAAVVVGCSSAENHIRCMYCIDKKNCTKYFFAYNKQKNATAAATFFKILTVFPV